MTRRDSPVQKGTKVPACLESHLQPCVDIIPHAKPGSVPPAVPGSHRPSAGVRALYARLAPHPCPGAPDLGHCSWRASNSWGFSLGNHPWAESHPAGGSHSSVWSGCRLHTRPWGGCALSSVLPEWILWEGLGVGRGLDQREGGSRQAGGHGGLGPCPASTERGDCVSVCLSSAPTAPALPLPAELPSQRPACGPSLDGPCGTSIIRLP